MKTPTTGTEVFSPVTVNSSASTQSVDAGFPVDLVIKDYRNLVNGAMWVDRLRGITSSTNPRLISASTGAEVSSGDINGAYQTGVTEVGIGTGYTSIDWFLKRAAGFFDVVCYTGNGTAGRTVNHNLTVAPELIIVKYRNASQLWGIYSASLGATKKLNFNDFPPAVDSMFWNNTEPTSSVFTVGNGSITNGSTGKIVAYLFATLNGVSKVGSYTGNGSSQTINCGFTTGARFIMIRRSDDGGAWYVWDTARGISAGNDSHLSLNTTAAEVTSDDTIDANSSGFIVNQVAATDANVNAATYIFLAIA
jgi:hypothetical protein